MLRITFGALFVTLRTLMRIMLLTTFSMSREGARGVRGEGEGASEIPERPHEGPKGVSEGPKGTREGPKGASEGLIGASKEPKGASEGQKRASEGPKGASEGPKWASEGPKGASEGPTSKGSVTVWVSKIVLVWIVSTLINNSIWVTPLGYFPTSCFCLNIFLFYCCHVLLLSQHLTILLPSHLPFAVESCYSIPITCCGALDMLLYYLAAYSAAARHADGR
jgi:hypothetical protein